MFVIMSSIQTAILLMLAQRNTGWAKEVEKGTVGRHLTGIRGLFMFVPHILVLIYFNQSEPSGVRIHLLSLSPGTRRILIYFNDPKPRGIKTEFTQFGG